MRSKALADQTLLGTPEKCAKGYQVPGRSPLARETTDPEDRNEYRAWVTTWWVCQMLVTGMLLVALIGCGGSGSSGSTGSSPTPPNAVPSISSVTPPNTNAGGDGVTIAVVGQGFVSNSTVQWHGSNRATTEMSATQLTANLTAADVSAAGAAQITVVSPAPGGGTSNPVGFVINGTEAAAVPAFLYVANSPNSNDLAGDISEFSVDPNTGILTPVSGSPFQLVSGVSALATDPSSRFLYGSSGTDVFAFTINPTTGALTAVPGSPFSTGTLSDPLSLAVDSTGKFLYVADFQGDGSPSGNNIAEFSINASTGALAPIPQGACSVPSTGGLPTALVADPTAQFIFVSSIAGGGAIVCSFSINSQGVLEPVTGSPVSLATDPLNTDPRAAAVDPSGKFVYLANFTPGNTSMNIWAFSITPGSGSLNPVVGSPFSVGAGVNDLTSLTMDPLGRFLYVGDVDENVPGLSINTRTGALSILAGSTTESTVLPVTPSAVDPSGKFLYVETQNSNSQGTSLSAFAIDQTTGALTPVSGSPFPDADGKPVALIVVRKPQ